MNKYIVVIEFDDLIEVDEKIYDLLCSMGHTEQLTEHSFLVATEQDVVYVHDSIKNSPYDVGSIFVITVESPAARRKVIVGNVHIGKHCVIGANSVVTKDIPDYSVAAGIPAKVIKKFNFDKKMWMRV